MPDNLTTLITRVQKAMIDDGTNYTTDTCTAAIREALKTFNIYVPVFAADLLTVIDDQLVYEVNDVDERAISLLGVWQYDANENHTALYFDVYSEDERIFFRLRQPAASGQLLIRYTIPQTIAGLDSETDSTLSAIYEQTLITGARAEAMHIRANSRVETINLQQKVSKNYLEQIEALRMRFLQELKIYADNRYPAVGTPADAAWNDAWYGWR